MVKVDNNKKYNGNQIEEIDLGSIDLEKNDIFDKSAHNKKSNYQQDKKSSFNDDFSEDSEERDDEDSDDGEDMDDSDDGEDMDDS